MSIDTGKDMLLFGGEMNSWSHLKHCWLNKQLLRPSTLEHAPDTSDRWKFSTASADLDKLWNLCLCLGLFDIYKYVTLLAWL